MCPHRARAGFGYGHQSVEDGIIKDGLWDVYNQVHGILYIHLYDCLTLHLSLLSPFSSTWVCVVKIQQRNMLSLVRNKTNTPEGQRLRTAFADSNATTLKIMMCH